MANIIVGFNNLANNCTLSGGSWQGTLPLNNLKDRRLYKIARSTNDSAASTQFSVDFGVAKLISVFSLIKHNFSMDATARLIASDLSDFSNVIYDSGSASVWPSVPSAILEWEDDNFWSGVPTREQIEMFQGILLWVVPNIGARYWKVTIVDENNPNGYVDLGRLFVSKDFTPIFNASYGLSFSVVDKSTVEESLGGVEHYDEKARVRSVDFSLDNLQQDEAFGRWYRMMLGQGNTGEVLFVYDHEDNKYTLDRSFLGRLERMNPLTTPYFDNWQSGATILETT